MTTVVDTNAIAALWDRDDALNAAAQFALDAALGRGNLVAPARVYAELMAFAGRTESFLDSFFRQTSIAVDWSLEERVWRAAGQAFQDYAARRRKQRDSGSRRILADFLIGAYAARNGYALLTLDEGLYRAAFPALRIVTA
ncbi:MAG: type II toxin-antitoxin system VapC family toxin [Candidatus Sulfotelmatobacter sp.]